MEKSAAATTQFLEDLGRMHPEIDLPGLFMESVRSLSERDIATDPRKACAEGMKERIAGRISDIEANLEYIDFDIFASEAVKAMKPLRMSIRGETGREIRIAMPLDIPKVAAGIAEKWDDALRLSKLMIACVQKGEGFRTESGGKKVACERVEPEEKKRSKLWDASAKILKNAFKGVAKLTATAGCLAVMGYAALGGVHYGIQKYAPEEAPTPILAELGAGFGISDHHKALTPGEWKKGMEGTINDAAFDELMKTDEILSSFMKNLERASINPELQVEFVNKFWNILPGREDMDNYGKDEYFAKPSEMWANKSGDCEDYALAKYAMLRKVGFDKDDLHLLMTNCKDSGTGHAILAVKVNGEFKVLDNLTEDVMTIQQAAEKYELRQTMNESGTTMYKHASETKTAGMRM